MRIHLMLLLALLAAPVSRANTITETFTTDPVLNGWQVFGDTNLFQWDSAANNLAVTWDSSQTNSFFYHPLGAVYSKTNDFRVAFDLRLNDIAIGTTPGNPYSFQIAVGLINAGIATSGNYVRGYGEFPNLVEFDYFPNDINDYGATVSTFIISSQTNYSGGGFSFPLELATNTLYHVVMVYTATNQTLHTTMTANGAAFGPVQDAYLGGGFDDFQVDAVAINSYSDAGQFPGFGGSVLAHGTVDNFTFASPLPTEDFSQNPLVNGWKIFGNTNLFHWNPTNQNIEVTWDSTNANSYLYRPLGTVLTRDDAFSVSFDLQLNDAVAFNFGSEVAVGLFHFSDATNAAFARGGGNSPNLFEFDYFPDTGFGDSIDATLKDAQPGYAGFYFAYDNQTLQPGVTYQVILNHAAGATNITGQVLTNGVLFTALPFSFPSSITDFRVDTLSISSYQDDGFGDSVLAHGTVDNFVLSLPPPPVQNITGSFTNSIWQAQFTSRSNWIYTLQRTADFQTWTDASAATPGNGTNLFLQDTNTPLDQGLYRVKADRP